MAYVILSENTDKRLVGIYKHFAVDDPLTQDMLDLINSETAPELILVPVPESFFIKFINVDELRDNIAKNKPIENHRVYGQLEIAKMVANFPSFLEKELAALLERNFILSLTNYDDIANYVRNELFNMRKEYSGLHKWLRPEFLEVVCVNFHGVDVHLNLSEYVDTTHELYEILHVSVKASVNIPDQSAGSKSFGETITERVEELAKSANDLTEQAKVENIPTPLEKRETMILNRRSDGTYSIEYVRTFKDRAEAIEHFSELLKLTS